MIRNFKVLGLTLVAVLALGALAAASASARFDSEAKKTTLAGGQTTTHSFTVEAGTTTCGEASFPGAQEGAETSAGSKIFTTSTITVTPSYKKCSTNVLGSNRETHVSMNGCDYRFNAGTTTESGTKVDGSVDIVCSPSTNEIKVEITGAEFCEVTVPAQTAVAGITFHNKGTGSSRDVLVEANVTALKYTQHGVFCPGNSFSSTKTFTNGKYSGTTTETGKNTESGAAVGIWVT